MDYPWFSVDSAVSRKQLLSGWMNIGSTAGASIHYYKMFKYGVCRLSEIAVSSV